MATLYAWVTPAFIHDSPLDHTWVTDYDNRANAYPSITVVEQHGANYWFCWGNFHEQGDSSELPNGFLGSATGDISLAQCLCLPNVLSDSIKPEDRPNACGTIYHYAIDGVCHQLANQVLWATGNAATAPLTVAQARGYRISSFIYGTYGLLHHDWKENQSRCTVAPAAESSPGAATLMDPNDDFALHAKQALDSLHASHKLAPLLALRQKMMEEQLADRKALVEKQGTLSAEALNNRNWNYLQRAAALLSSAEYEAVFGFQPSQRVDLVDPTLLRSSPDEKPSR